MGVKQLFSKVAVWPRHITGMEKRANRVAPALASKWEQGLGEVTSIGV